jgi:hypothetical protein
MHAVLVADPFEFELRHGGERIAIGRDEAAQDNRPRAQHRDAAAQAVDIAGLDRFLAIIEFLAKLDDFGIEFDADRLGQRRDKVAAVLEPPGAHRHLDLAQRSERSA